MFDQLYEVDRNEPIPVFWSTPMAQEITDFVWDTSVVQISEPWPNIEPQTVREAMTMILGHNEVTGYLFTHQDMLDYEATHNAVKGLCAPCVNCGDYCGDKWCGLRGDEETEVIDGEFQPGPVDLGSGGAGVGSSADRTRDAGPGLGGGGLQVPLADDGGLESRALEGGADHPDGQRVGEEGRAERGVGGSDPGDSVGREGNGEDQQ